MFVGVKCLRMERNGVFIARTSIRGAGNLWEVLNAYYTGWLKLKDSLIDQKWRRKELWERYNVVKNELHDCKPGTELYIECLSSVENCELKLEKCEKVIASLETQIAEVEAMTFITYDTSDLEGEPVNKITFNQLAEKITKLIVNL